MGQLIAGAPRRRHGRAGAREGCRHGGVCRNRQEEQGDLRQGGFDSASSQQYSVPLLINDRIDVYLSVKCAGIHIGQSDMPLETARALVGADAVIGISVSTIEDAEAAVAGGADYVGIGAVWPTESKDVRGKLKLGPDGVGKILDVLPPAMGSVAIGGIGLKNTAHLLNGSISPKNQKHLDGVAVISAIVASPEPKARAEELAAVVRSFVDSRKKAERGFFRGGEEATNDAGLDVDCSGLVKLAAHFMDVVRENTPLVHQITNNVVINDSANATLAVGASPIMATNPSDVADLSPAIGGLLINFGTITDKEGMLVAGRCANLNGKPLVFDPVAVGATSFRRETSKRECGLAGLTSELLSHWQPTVIKGNPAEIGALAESEEVAARGVDSTGKFKDPVGMVRQLARTRAAIVVMTGEVDYLSDGNIVLTASNGHHYLEVITGSGCMTGTMVATFCAAARLDSIKNGKQKAKAELVQGDMLAGALAGWVIGTTTLTSDASCSPSLPRRRPLART